MGYILCITFMMTQNKKAFNNETLIRLIYNKLLISVITDYSIRPYPGLIICGFKFKKHYIQCNDIYLLTIAVIVLLIKFAYFIECINIKFTIGYIINIPTAEEEISITLSKAILFKYNGEYLPVYESILKVIAVKAEEYDRLEINNLYLRIYLTDLTDLTETDLTDLTEKENKLLIPKCDLNTDEMIKKICEIINLTTDNNIDEIIKLTPTHSNRKSRYPKYLTSLKPSGKTPSPFIVADTETLIKDKIHIPYSVGFMEVYKGCLLSPDMVETYYSSDYPELKFKTLEERRDKMFFDFIERLTVVTKKRDIKTVYFHNLARFDGFLLMKYFVTNDKYKVIPLIRNNNIYEIKFYNKEKLLFTIKDSLRMLPNKINELAEQLCPHLGSKGVVEHDKIQESNIVEHRSMLLEYMKQDIVLLAGVMLKAQDIYWNAFNVDIVTKLTLSSLALCIFRTHYYDEKNWYIHIPSKNEDTFIRRGYYGGHADVYSSIGNNLYYYDVNSLYPFIMKTFSMPGGKPVWHNHLEDQELNNLFGFIEAYVECPPHIDHPFLPHRNKKLGTLEFGTGEFVGVYFSEELKYARKLGYKIIPFSGYLFENKNSSPFGEFITDIFGKRQEAKKAGNTGMSYVYKTLMNSLYGRFGIIPKHVMTEICDYEQYNKIVMLPGFINGNQLNDNKFIASYWVNDFEEPTGWIPPRISAIQLAAAITAYARIYMYEFISRDDCYYTDTDSVILGNPLPKEVVSSTELGKFKLEYNNIDNAIFLAPKSYTLKTESGDIIKHKGASKDFVTPEWFKSQQADPSKEVKIKFLKRFNVEKYNLDITMKEFNTTLGIKTEKREIIKDADGIWVGTAPIRIYDIDEHHKKRILEYENKCLKKNEKKNKEELLSKEREIEELKMQLARYNNSNK